MFTASYDFEIQQFFIYYNHGLVGYFDPKQKPKYIDFCDIYIYLYI